MHTDPDTQLMLQFKAGDQRAFQHLFDKHKKRVINYCFRYCGNAAMAEEMAQETFLRVYKAARRYRPKARFTTWLFKIAANVCRNEIRKPAYRAQVESLNGNTVPELPSDNGPTGSGCGQPDALFEESERHALVRAAIQRLPEQQREALLLRVNEEFSYREIGRQINRPEGHVKTLIYRGRQQLKKMLGAYFGVNHE
ncbi:MAG: RNA polymerase sigma factor [Desulfobacteraceae bacterium]|jgi:RNA polymerase sigma-70 factor, ECF subfamily